MIRGAMRGYRGWRALTVAVLAAGAMLAATASGASAITVSNVQAVPANLSAGANSDLAVDFNLSGGKLKDLVIHLPPGLVGNPLATPTCTEAELNANSCPAASDVGDISNDVLFNDLIPLTVSGNVYNVVPKAGEPARFGFVLTTPGNLIPPVILQSPAALRPGDFGLDTILKDVPNTASGTPITITGIHLDLKGQVGSPAKGFLRNPTSCGTHVVSIDATAHDASTGSGQTSFDTFGCADLPFDPKFDASIVSDNPKQPVKVSTTISQTEKEAGLKRAVVTLPAELGPNGTAFGNTCTEADFQAGNCPEASIVGSAKAASPLQSQALEGPVVLIATPAGSLPKLGLDLRGALALKLIGDISINSSNPNALRNEVTFDGLPDIPISEFTLTFAGGPGGLNLATRNPCASPPFKFDTTFLSHGGVTTQGATDADATCRGSQPKLKAKLKTPKNGEPTLKLKLKAGGLSNIGKARLKLPKSLGLAKGAKLKRGLDVEGAKAKGKKSGLRLKARKGGAKRITVVIGDGAISPRGKKVKGKIKADVKALDGQRTKLSVKLK